MDKIEWGADVDVDSQEVENALQRVRKEGDHKRQVRRGATVATSAVALVAVIGLMVSNQSSNTPRIAQPPTSSTTPTQVPLSLVAQVTKTATAAISSLHSVSATEVSTSHTIDLPDYKMDALTSTQKYRYAKDGSYYSSFTNNYGKSTDVFREAYDAKTGVITHCGSSTGDAQAFCFKRFQQPDGPKSFGVLTARIDAATKANSASAAENNDGDRKVWTVQYDQQESKVLRHVTLTVDRETGLPFRTVETVNGLPEREMTLTNLVVNPSFRPAELQLYITPNSNMTDETVDNFEGRSFGTTVAAPVNTFAPLGTVDGFTTREVWTIQHGTFNSFNECGNENGLTAFAQAVGRSGLLSYRTSVLDRHTCKGAAATPDEKVIEPETLRPVKSITATRGALQGGTFTIYAQVTGELFLMGQSDAQILYVRGDLHVSQLEELVNSFTF